MNERVNVNKYMTLGFEPISYFISLEINEICCKTSINIKQKIIVNGDQINYWI